MINRTHVFLDTLFHPTTLKDYFHIFQVMCVHEQIMYRNEAEELLNGIEYNNHERYWQGDRRERLVDAMAAALEKFPIKSNECTPGDLSFGEGSNNKLIQYYTFEEIWSEPSVGNYSSAAPITFEMFLHADKRSLTRAEWVCLDRFISKGGRGWRCALLSQNDLWDYIPEGRIIDNIRSAMIKLGYDPKSYLNQYWDSLNTLEPVYPAPLTRMVLTK